MASLVNGLTHSQTSPHPAGRIVASQRRKVDERDRLQEPGGLIVLLHAPPPKDLIISRRDSPVSDFEPSNCEGHRIRLVQIKEFIERQKRMHITLPSRFFAFVFGIRV